MIDLINISIQSDFNFVGDIYVSMIKSRNNHILLTIALLLGWVIKKEVSTIIQVMNITSSMGGMVMCAEKTGGFNLVNYRHSSGVYHEQETEDLHRRI